MKLQRSGQPIYARLLFDIAGVCAAVGTFLPGCTTILPNHPADLASLGTQQPARQSAAVEKPHQTLDADRALETHDQQRDWDAITVRIMRKINSSNGTSIVVCVQLSEYVRQ